MKKFFVVLGVIFTCLIILGVIFISIAARTGSKLDAESKAYVDRIVPLIVASWDPKELLNNASPELLKVAPSDKLDSMFKMFAEKLGGYKEYKGSKGDSLVNITPQGKTITAAYITQVAFDKADATVKIRVIKHGEKWQVLEFYVDSQAFMP
jgi:hypothetical protein